MTAELSLLPLIQAGEGETLEFKERWTSSALETLAAFANTRGGTLLVGVDDRGQVNRLAGGGPRAPGGRQSDRRRAENPAPDHRGESGRAFRPEDPGHPLPPCPSPIRDGTTAAWATLPVRSARTS